MLKMLKSADEVNCGGVLNIWAIVEGFQVGGVVNAVSP
jgi:hypothetical protein